MDQEKPSSPNFSVEVEGKESRPIVVFQKIESRVMDPDGLKKNGKVCMEDV